MMPYGLQNLEHVILFSCGVQCTLGALEQSNPPHPGAVHITIRGEVLSSLGILISMMFSGREQMIRVSHVYRYAPRSFIPVALKLAFSVSLVLGVMVAECTTCTTTLAAAGRGAHHQLFVL